MWNNWCEYFGVVKFSRVEACVFQLHCKGYSWLVLVVSLSFLGGAFQSWT